MSPPKVQLNALQRWRLAGVGLLVAFAAARTTPDAIRLFEPLGIFDYATDANGTVASVPARVPKGSDALRAGDRVRIDRIKPFDRKPGLALDGFTRENFDRRLPIERAGRERTLHLVATPESPASRAIALLRVLLFLISIAFGAILVIVKPRIATLAFFMFTIGAQAPSTYTDVFFDVPWREIPTWIGDTLQGGAPVALLLFSTCLASAGNKSLRRVLAVLLGIAAAVLATLHAYAFWRVSYAGLPAAAFANAYTTGESIVSILNVLAFATAFVVARGADRQRTGYILAAFALAGGARLLSERYFPADSLANGLLLALGVVPSIVVWVAVVKHHFFNVDFVVSRALVYTAITAAVIGVIGSSEELLSYVFYNNTDLATGVVIAISMGVGACFGKVKEWLDHFVDRFVFRERRHQRTTLERIAANLIDAEDEETVLRALLHDVPSVLELSFSGIMTRQADGGYVLAEHWQWPSDGVERLAPTDAFALDVVKKRGVLSEAAIHSKMVTALFPQTPLTYAAPLYVDRMVSALVLYGRSVSGLDLDPDERLCLVRVMSNASIALASIELARYRPAEASPAMWALTGEH